MWAGGVNGGDKRLSPAPLGPIISTAGIGPAVSSERRPAMTGDLRSFAGHCVELRRADDSMTYHYPTGTVLGTIGVDGE